MPFGPPDTVPSMFQGFRTTLVVRRILLTNPRFEQFSNYVERQCKIGTNFDIWNVDDREGPTRTYSFSEG